MRRRWRSSYYADHEIDLFDYKEEFINAISDKELEDELKRREEENDSVSKERTNFYVDVDIDISDYADEAIETAGDDELICELEDRGYSVNDKQISPHFRGGLKELAQYLGLRSWATKEQVLEEINYYIGDGK